MKKIMLTIVVLGGVLNNGQLMAQTIKSNAVPAQVTLALKQKYPQATKITWEKEKGNFEANWGGKSGEDMSVMFSPAGAFIEQVAAIPVSALPSGISVYVKTHYKGAKISEAGKITDANGATKYEAEVKGKDLIFNEKGNFLKED